MKGIEALIKVHAFELDEKRRALKQVQEFQNGIENALAQLEEQVADEQAAARGSDEGAYAYGGFAQSVIQRRAALQETLVSAKAQVDVAREAVALAFETLKKYEITKAGRDSEALTEARRRERILLDELGLNAYSRAKETWP
jgi:flagellar export protein FliJ